MFIKTIDKNGNFAKMPTLIGFSAGATSRRGNSIGKTKLNQNMKLTKTLAVAITSLALVGGALAHAPCSEKVAREYLKALAKDDKQDASGQAKLDRLWADLVKKGVATGPNPLVYEGSAKDLKQDAKLNEKLTKQFEKCGLVFTSPIT